MRRPAVLACVLAGAVAVLATIVWAAASGPHAAIQGGHVASTRTAAATPTPLTPKRHDFGARNTGYQAPTSTLDLSWVGEVLEVVVIVAFLAGLAMLARAAAERLRARTTGERIDADFDVLPGEARDRLRRRTDDLHAVLEHGSVRNAVVAVWLGFEDSVQAAGIEADPAETSTQLVTRVLHRLDVDPRAVGTLASLYHEARFSSHDLPETARDRARAALRVIDADLADPVEAR